MPNTDYKKRPASSLSKKSKNNVVQRLSNNNHDIRLGNDNKRPGSSRPGRQNYNFYDHQRYH